jgi:hypothetical protein
MPQRYHVPERGCLSAAKPGSGDVHIEPRCGFSLSAKGAIPKRARNPVDLIAMLDRIGETLRGLKTGGLEPGSIGAYLFAFASIGVAGFAHLAVSELTTGMTPSIFYNPAIFVAALVGGIRAGLVAIGLSLVLLLGILHSRYVGGSITTFSAGFNSGLFLSAALVIIWVAERYRSLASGEIESGEAEMEPISRSLQRYVGALACVAAATGLRLGFGWVEGDILPFVSYYPAILIAALIGGMGPALLAIFASLCVIWTEFPAPLLPFELPTRDKFVSLSVYVFASLLTVWLAEKRRYAGARNAESPILQWVTSILVACSAVMLTTLVLLGIDVYLAEEHLVLGYLLPTIVIAMHYGSTLAVITSFISGFAAAYFLFAPRFSFYIADPLNVAELAFFLLLAITASKAVAGLTDDLRARNARSSPRGVKQAAGRFGGGAL